MKKQAGQPGVRHPYSKMESTYNAATHPNRLSSSLTTHSDRFSSSLTANIFVILGVARSGTSVIARALKTLGINLGDHLTPPGKWNPTGFWEDNDVVYQINQRLLDQLNFRWDSTKLLELNNEKPICKTMQASATAIIKQRYLHHNHWGFKDPRTVRILPFWQTIFTTLQLNEHYVIALRNPLCSANSFSDLGRNDMEKGLLLWLMHLFPAIEQTHGKKRIVVSYENMMQDPSKELERIQQQFNLPPVSAEEKQQYVEKFLDKKLDHYHFTYADLVSHPATKISALILKCYDCLWKLAQDELRFDNPAFTTLWNDIKQEFINNYVNYCYIDTLLIENTQMRKNLRSIQRSLSWRMIYPLRFVEQGVRLFRRWIKGEVY